LYFLSKNVGYVLRDIVLKKLMKKRRKWKRGNGYRKFYWFSLL